ncbi:MAG: TonB-dependent receptor [Candidatus Marinimicrobia bacterium]|nr:TonB-dependent receptor [Candidatus Neomarinimicrobiota bacterium]
MNTRKRSFGLLLSIALFSVSLLMGQGVTTAGLSGSVTDMDGNALAGANVVAVYTPTGAQYGAATRASGAYTILNMKVGGPYTIKVDYIGYKSQSVDNVSLNLGATERMSFQLSQEAISMAGVEVTADMDDVMNGDRTGAATFISSEQVVQMPSIKRSTRDLTRMDPRSDGNFSFGGRNWLYNNISLDGSYFNNPFGLDDPAPGGQTNAEPVSFDAVEQVQVSVAPFDVREGGFTGAGINTVTKSGTNTLTASVYTYTRNESFVGNSVAGSDVAANPELSFNQSGVSVGGPLVKDKVFFFANYEMERRSDPASNFVADRDGNVEFGESRVTAEDMEAISARMKDVYDYDTGAYEGYNHETNNDKMLLKLDVNINANHNASFRYSRLDANRDLPPHFVALSYNNTGRGPNTTSLPFENSGYKINNVLDSYAGELNSTFGGNIANRFFFSMNKFRDWRTPKSEDFPTIQIGEEGVAYATLGHEPFSIHNILDQDVLQVTNNLSFFSGDHVFTAGVNYENFKFFNSFNIFRNFFFGLGFTTGLTTFDSVDDFMAATDPTVVDSLGNPTNVDFRAFNGSGDFKGELIDVSQMAFYGQDEWAVNDNFNLIYGLRVDIPVYNTQPVENPYSTGLSLLDENGEAEVVDQAKLPDSKPLYSPRFGFNWDVKGDRSMQVRGGSGIFTGRLPFVWIGNVISNPGSNPNLPGDDPTVTDDGVGRPEGEGTQSTLQPSFDLNAMVDDFEWPQIWTTNFALDMALPNNMVGTFEMVYGKDLNAIYMRNADLIAPISTLSDGRPYYGGWGNNELNAMWPGEGAGAYVIDNTEDQNGYNLTLTAQLRKSFSNGFDVSAAYTYLDAQNNLKSTEIASLLWQGQPVQGDPNNPTLAPSEFGNRHRIIATANYRQNWNDNMSTNFGLFFEMAEGNRYTYSGGNRYSHVYSNDLNGDGYSNDLIYIPTDANDIVLADPTEWDALNAFIEQDPYLSQNRGQIAERNGLVNPWFSNVDLKILNEFNTSAGKFQLSFDVLNFGNLINDGWGVRQVADQSALAPLSVTEISEDGVPTFDFNGAESTFINDASVFSRWQLQIGLRYIF